VLVLALDTATPAVTAGVVELSRDGVARPLAQRVTLDARAHAEVLTSHIMECLAEAGIDAAGLDALVAGTGPGPFTGLRVGMATAAAFGDAISVPVYGVCSLDAIAAQVHSPAVLVVSDARRREVYWARYADGARVEGPGVGAPADVSGAPSLIAAGSPAHAGLFGLPVAAATAPTPASLVEVAAPQVLSREEAGPLEPLYLRRPDAKTLAERAAEKAARERKSGGPQ
jgi:tRNA threonylcarbamoyl adenosine modification protein YeaZ